MFLYGFAKSERENVDKDELISLKEIATAWIKASDQKISDALSNGLLKEVNYE